MAVLNDGTKQFDHQKWVGDFLFPFEIVPIEFRLILFCLFVAFDV